MNIIPEKWKDIKPKINDFKYNLDIRFKEDDSLVKFNYCFWNQRDGEIIVFTEYCGYHVFDNCAVIMCAKNRNEGSYFSVPVE